MNYKSKDLKTGIERIVINLIYAICILYIWSYLLASKKNVNEFEVTVRTKKYKYFLTFAESDKKGTISSKTTQYN